MGSWYVDAKSDVKVRTVRPLYGRCILGDGTPIPYARRPSPARNVTGPEPIKPSRWSGGSASPSMAIAATATVYSVFISVVGCMAFCDPEDDE